MLWFKKRPDAALPAAADEIVPAALPLALDAGAFKHYFTTLVENAGQDGGIESCLAALGAKQHVCIVTLERAREAVFTMGDIEALLDHMFTARRRLCPALERLGAARTAALVGDLVAGAPPPAQRLQAFVDTMPGAERMDRESLKAAAKVRRAAWDFAAELLHFSDPVKFPLMSRWVWDQGTQSGALREFIRGNDAMREIPFGNDPGLFEGARRWFAERIAEEGVYRDVHFWIDLVLAQAYTTYFRSVTDGSLGADFGRGVTAQEQLRKLLGIDATGSRRSRVKKAAMSNG